ncbi:MAG: FadR/GntR family transcriptional regulator [Caldilinea sp.]|jgi:GntR family transcriptional repressor for pyruvate dehydrogenase complex
MQPHETYKPLRTAALYQQMADQIKERIFRNELQEGEQLPNETELAEQFGVSRTVVREAMKRLEQEGFVEVQRGRGTFVVYRAGEAVRQSIGNLMEAQHDDSWQALVEVRELLEPGIAYLAALRADDEAIAALRAAVATMDQAMNDADAYIDADNAFHLALARATGNSLVTTLVEPMVALLSAQRKDIFMTPSGPQDGQYHHKRILLTIEQHDAEAAKRCMVEHLQQVRRDTQMGLAR